MPNEVEQINPTTYRIRFVEDEVEIGDIDAPTFIPHAKLKRWGEECFLRIKPAGVITEVELEVEQYKVKSKYKAEQNGFELEIESEFYAVWKVPKSKLRQIYEQYELKGSCNNCFNCCNPALGMFCEHYNPGVAGYCEIGIDRPTQVLQPGESLESWKARRDPRCRLSIVGLYHNPPPCTYYLEERQVVVAGGGQEIEGLEFNIVLNQKPPTNKVVFDIETQGLKFYYQPALTQEEIRGGAFRPMDVVGSYAVYHTTRGNIHSSRADGDKYKCGKAFHIFRPQVVDADGNRVWGELDIDVGAGTLTVTIPQEFLDTAVYPIRQAAGLNFGWTGVGLTEWGIGDMMTGSVFTTPAGGSIDMDDIRAYCEFGDDTNYYRYAIYKHSNSAQVANSLTADTQASGATQWWPIAYDPKPSLDAATAYVLVIGADNPKTNHSIFWDAGDVDQGHEEEITYPTLPATANFNHENRKCSIYCIFTPAGGGAAGGAGSLAAAAAALLT